MAEASKVRLVRCPKCGNLLPEPPHFSIYECGGCGAVLRAKNKGILEDGLSEISEDGGGRGVDEKGDITIDSGNASETERETNGAERGRIEQKNRSERAISNGSSILRTENMKVLIASDGTRGGEKTDLRLDQTREVELRGEENYRRHLRSSVDDLGKLDVNRNRLKYVNSGFENEPEGIRPPVRSMRSRSVIDDWDIQRNGPAASYRSGMGITRQGGFDKFPYVDEGPSNYETSSYHGYGGKMRYSDSTDGLSRVAHLESDRAELLKKLDELKNQISGTGNVPEKSGDRIAVGLRPPTPPDPYARNDAYRQEEFLYGYENHPLPSDIYVSRTPHDTYSHGQVPFVDRHDSISHDAYPPKNFSNSISGYGPYYPPISRRPPHEAPRQYSQRTYQDHFPDYYMNFSRDPFMSQPHETFFHQPACSCTYCVNKNRQDPAKIHNPGLIDPRSRNGPTSAASYHHLDTAAMSAKGYSLGGPYSRLQPRDRQSLTRTPSDLDSEKGVFYHQRLRRGVAKGRPQVCHPVAGGAPFITCCNCFELLKMPRNLEFQGKNQIKLRCGACSSTLLFTCGSKGIVVAVLQETKQASEDISDFSNQISNDKIQSYHEWPEVDAVKPYSSGHDNSKYNDKLTDSERELSSEQQRSNFTEFEKRQYPEFSTSSFSGDEQSPDSVIVREDVSHSAELLLQHDTSSSLHCSPHKGNPDHPPSNGVADKCGKVLGIEHVDDERVIVEKVTSRQGSVKDASLASEMDLSVNEYCNSGISEVSKEGDISRINKFAGLMKWSFKDFSRSGQSTENDKFNVFINGHPIPDRVVKKAEKVAGPIQPGDYWYDRRAGFWGVMGHPCFGIIPPKIEEFNYPMPEDCANGTTKVYVNGRELHQKDLDLLSRRGLPITRHKSYLIEISGKVVDEHTGEGLDSLGKLAPTVESVGHGFGMKVPKSIARQA